MFSKGTVFFLVVFIPSMLTSLVLFWVVHILERRFLADTLAKHQDFKQFLAEQQQFVRQSFEKGSTVSLPITSPTVTVATPAQPKKRTVPSTPVRWPNVREDELWDALSLYREEQRRTPLVREESLCVYARSRVKELEGRTKTVTGTESPLDGHAGFQRDADSGALFSQTGFSAIAENLAYLPGYKTATQIIEWGWDSSSSHREAQLDNEWTHACVVGTYPFYVAIFARR